MKNLKDNLSDRKELLKLKISMIKSILDGTPVLFNATVVDGVIHIAPKSVVAYNTVIYTKETNA